MGLRAISSMATRHVLQELSDAAAAAGLVKGKPFTPDTLVS